MQKKKGKPLYYSVCLFPLTKNMPESQERMANTHPKWQKKYPCVEKKENKYATTIETLLASNATVSVKSSLWMDGWVRTT